MKAVAISRALFSVLSPRFPSSSCCSSITSACGRALAATDAALFGAARKTFLLRVDFPGSHPPGGRGSPVSAKESLHAARMQAAVAFRSFLRWLVAAADRRRRRWRRAAAAAGAGAARKALATGPETAAVLCTVGQAAARSDRDSELAKPPLSGAATGLGRPGRRLQLVALAVRCCCCCCWGTAARCLG